jgi:hypothetical protein
MMVTTIHDGVMVMIIMREMQGCGSGFNRVSGSGSRRAKMTHRSRKRNYMFEVLDVLFQELKASFVTW